MRLHIVALPHAQTVDELTVCAFTTKTLKFCEMMGALGYETVLYSGDRNDARCTEHVELYNTTEQESWYGETDPNTLPSIATFDGSDAPWRTMNARAIAAILARAESGDPLLLLGGDCQTAVAAGLPHLLACEYAAGYKGWFTDYVCFESYAWMHHCYGLRGIEAGRWFDTVIPNFFRPDDFALGEKGDYLLFVGRLIASKGLSVAGEIARETELPLVVAGSGAASYENGRLVTFDGIELENVEYVGTVGTEERNKLMAGARAVLAPTTYIEPFGAVAVEAQLCGTPAITTDWGAFPETVEQGVTGFRFRTLAEGIEAVQRADELEPAAIRGRALARYSLDAVGPLYDDWFRRLATLWHDGWYALPAAA